MDNRIYLINLYDYYGQLLTIKQQEYFEDYYFDNLSLSEIGENRNISRSAISKQLKEIAGKLEFYEDKLNLYEKGIQINKIISNLDDKLQDEIKDLI